MESKGATGLCTPSGASQSRVECSVDWVGVGIRQTRGVLLELPFPQIDPIAFSIGPLKVHWYALMYMFAFVMGYVLMRRRLRKEPYSSITKPKPWSTTDVEDIIFAAVVGVIVGGRLGYVLFYNWASVAKNPISVFYVWQGGMSFHGGLVGVILGLWWVSWRSKRPFLQITDILVPAAPIGLAAGRIGNFLNGELWGRQAPEWLPWAVVFPKGGDVLRHPSQLYQALLEGLLLFVLLWWYANKPRYRGQVSGSFLFGYGVFRFTAEFFREPDAQLGILSLGLSMGQWLSLPMIIAGAALWFWSRKRAVWDVEDQDDEASADSEATESEQEEADAAQDSDSVSPAVEEEEPTKDSGDAERE